MTRKTKYRANPVVSFRDEGDEGAVLYNPDTDQCVVLNFVGCAVWRYLEKPRTIDEIISLLYETFSGVKPEKVRNDLKQFINDLEENFINEIS